MVEGTRYGPDSKAPTPFVILGAAKNHYGVDESIGKDILL
jgi:hypothetical protein